MELMGSATRLRQGYGVPSIEGKAATGSGERAGEASEFQIRGEIISAFPRRVFGKRDQRAKGPRQDRA